MGVAMAVARPGLAAAQAPALPNSSFETWTLRGGTEAPDAWLTSDDIVEFITQQRIATGTITKAGVAQHDTLAVQLQTRTLPGVGQVSGDIILGSSLRGVVEDLPSGIACTARPAALLTRPQLSTATLKPIFFRWKGTRRLAPTEPTRT